MILRNIHVLSAASSLINSCLHSDGEMATAIGLSTVLTEDEINVSVIYQLTGVMRELMQLVRG